MAAIDPELAAALARVAPGTELRDGLERIMRGRTGALIVLGHDKGIDALISGGFPLDIDFTSTRLRELCKMDGAVIIDSATSKIVRAGTQLVPDPAIPTGETGTRHRTADRVARQTGYPVVSVSKSMHIIALYLKGRRYVLEEPAAILSRANQALATLERYKQRLDEVSRSLSALEIEDLVTVREVCATLQRLEMVRHIANEIRAYLLELGTEGRLVSLQLAELVAGVETDRELVVRDYLPRTEVQPQGAQRGRHAGGPGPDRAHGPVGPHVRGTRPGLPGQRRRAGDQCQPAGPPGAVPRPPGP